MVLSTCDKYVYKPKCSRLHIIVRLQFLNVGCSDHDMEYLKLLLLVVILLSFREVLCDDCVESGDTAVEECEDTEYTSYIECVRRRTKRHAGCSQNCDACECSYCSSGGCSSHCNVCCANFEQPCQTKYCCYKTCHSQCSHQDCRDSCRRTCTDRIQGHKETFIHTHAGQAQTPNITTIINLHNKINNTNIIDVPINLKTDNINNITINTGDYGSNATLTGNYGGGQSCCQVVSPRQCTPTKEFPFVRCFHLRKRVCSNICKSNIMHAQPHQVCDQRDVGPPDCHDQVIYIPQPQPKCTYKSEWPYISCNIPAANCEGCYEHYGTNAPRPANCPDSCYEQGGGYGVGPFVQFPFYRPPIPQLPNCMQLGSCPPYYGGGGPGYGFPSGGGSNAVPFSGIGYVPSAYENNYVVHVNPEMPDMSKLFINLTQNGDYDAQTLPITNSITHPPPILEPRLVKVETVNATDVFMTIKELNDDGSVGDNDVTTLPSAAMAGPSITGGSPSYVGADISSMGADIQPIIRQQRHDKTTTGASSEPIDVMMADEGKSATTKPTTTASIRSSITTKSNPAKLAAGAS
ncbi:hypothetical protein Trydic_g15497 [Trypoxylus dichotomus]